MSFLPHSFGCGLPIRDTIKRLYPILTTLAIGPLLFREQIQGLDLLAVGLTIFGLFTRYNLAVLQYLNSLFRTGIYSQQSSSAASLSQLARSYLHSILENPESRKIFYFLMLNMCYMLVQMLYGIWTNSLGLISDGQ